MGEVLRWLASVGCSEEWKMRIWCPRNHCTAPVPEPEAGPAIQPFPPSFLASLWQG